MAIRRRRSRDCVWEIAFVDIRADVSVAPIASRAANARVRSRRVGARSLGVAQICAKGTFVVICARHAVPGVPRRADTREGASRVRAVVDVEAVVRPDGTLVDLYAIISRLLIAAPAAARPTIQVRCRRWAREAI